MSRRPGIGQGWWTKFKDDPGDFIIRNGVKMRPPKYYDRQQEKLDLDLEDPDGFFDKGKLRKIKGIRKQQAAKHSEDNTRARLAVREKVQQAQAKRLKRGLEENDQ